VFRPTAAAVTNVRPALRWLDGHPSDLEEIRQALDAIIKDGTRANDVIGRIRAACSLLFEIRAGQRETGGVASDCRVLPRSHPITQRYCAI
jgi:hypothetical protein